MEEPSLNNENVYLRSVCEEDKDILLKWANDPLVRKNSFSSEYIKREVHEAWFYQMMNNPMVYQYIMEKKKDNSNCYECPIGQIRLVIFESRAEISYSIAAMERGKGYGNLMLELIKDEVRLHHPQIRELRAKVKLQNEYSKKIFKKAGFVERVCSDEIIFDSNGFESAYVEYQYLIA